MSYVAVAPVSVPDRERKEASTAWVSWFFLGGFAVHYFYLGRTGSAVTLLGVWLVGWLLTDTGVGFSLIGLAACWWVVDGFLLGGYVREANAE